MLYTTDCPRVEIVTYLRGNYPDLDVTEQEIGEVDGEWVIDGMCPFEWADAVGGDGEGGR